MPVDTVIEIPAREWKLVTTQDVSGLRVQSFSRFSIKLAGTSGLTPPADDTGYIELPPGQIIPADVPISSIWPGVPAVARVWAWSRIGGKVSVSYA